MTILHPKFDRRVAEEIGAVINFVKTGSESDFYCDLPDIKISSFEDFKKLPLLKTDEIKAKSEHLRHFPETEIRYLPSEFGTDKLDELFLMPQHYETIWSALDREIKNIKPSLAISVLPLIWQVGPMFYKTVLKNKMPAVVIPPRNLPVARQMIQQVGIEAIISTSDAAKELDRLLQEIKLEKPILFWHVVLPPQQDSDFKPASDTLVFLEKHLIPGILFAYQCKELAIDGNNKFHPSPDYFWEFENDTAIITSLRKTAFPFIRYKPDFAVAAMRRRCPCGDSIILDFSLSHF